MNTPVVFVDVETTGLLHYHQIWEVGLIEADGTEHHWFLPVDLGTADPFSLKMGRFYERYPRPSYGAQPEIVDGITRLDVFAYEFAELTRGKHLVGAVVSFDEQRLGKLLQLHGACPDWSHRVICVETLVAGYLRQPLPLKLSETADALGIKVDEDGRHTALGDARVARDVYMKVVNL